MKVLLTAVNAKYIHSNLAVYSLKASAGAWKDQIVIREFTINQSIQHILERLYMEEADVICFSCYIWNIRMIMELGELMGRIRPDIRIWLGGPEVSFDAKERLESCGWLEGVMCGEGEETFAELMDAFNGKRPIDTVDGITFRDGEGNIVERARRDYVDMDQLPFVYSHMDGFEHKIIYYESSRGCPFSCSYCLSSVEKKVRFRDTQEVKKELQQFIDWEVPQVKFVDRTFNCDRKHAMEILRYIKEHDRGKTNFHFEITADLLTEEEMDFMAGLRPGLIQLEIGVQSTNPRTLKEIRRWVSFEKLGKVVRRINGGHNIHQHLDLIAGLPYEDMESFRKSFNDVYALEPEQLQLGFLKVLKGSHMRERAGDYGLVYDPNPPYEVLGTKWISYKDLVELKGIEAVLEVYYNSRQFENSIRWLEHYFDTPYDMYQALAGWYREHGLNEVSQSRMDRYDILLDFASAVIKDEGAVQDMKQLLIYDLYLRENLKKRPEWAADQSEHKGFYTGFFGDASNRQRYVPAYAGYTAKQIQRMTHMEYFTFDVEATAAAGKPSGTGGYVLFDYKQRDPLTYRSRVEKIEVDGR